MTFSVNKIREQFPALNQEINNMKPVFLDGPGGSQVPTRVLDGMTNYLGHFNSNLGGHFFSSEVTGELVSKARLYAKTFLNAKDAEEIIFGANMTSLTFNLSRTIARDWTQDDEIIVTELDHYSNVSSWQQVADDKGCSVKHARMNADTCQLDMQHFESLLNANTKIVAITYASNATGSIVDLEAVIELAHSYGALVYVDAVHYAVHNLIDVQKLNCDFLVCSSYKFFGPHLGLAYIKDSVGLTLKPYKVEPAKDIGATRFETGTLNFEALAGFIECIEYLAQFGSGELRQKLEQSFKSFSAYEHTLTAYFLEKLANEPRIKLHGETQAQTELRTPTFALEINGFTSEQVAKHLGQYNICVWSGHFYALGVVCRLGLESIGLLRIGLMHYNTIEEVNTLFEALQELVNQN